VLFNLLSLVDAKLGITISIGVIETDDKFNFKENINQLISNMLLAKRNGKNKICLK
jgi:PleD family two-component response regulator